ncbi:MAG: hypothetical protein EPO52_06610 [Herbiconiux sp.]|uniref:hypothetical protein n=1 Tax=Herbiconiux sp. TaxID=1871186 RepID=UPI0011FE6E25|nr:hypothetical protein [Herbiconiux sp.]TAJ47867.1 MAG: hypothetical protein EPO52_06610 [Herbiconiux sp.]
MSTIRHPVGPQPKKVYWRRRLVVLFVLLAVIAVVVLIVVRPGSGAQGEPAPVAAPSASSTAAASTDAPADPAATPASGSDSAAETPAAPAVEAGDACDPSTIRVEPVTDAVTYAPGVNPQISFTITNTGSVACTVNAGTSQQKYTITSGAETYWVSTDCQSGASDTEALLEPNVPVSSTPFAWDRTRSSASTCGAADRAQVPGGGSSYHLNVEVGGVSAATTTQFILD